METPLSTRRITRSVAAAAAAAAASAQKSAAAADSAATTHFARAKSGAAPGDQPRAVLHDITNDSPIVGLAAGALRAAADKTPASTTTKTRPRPRRTPGSGEALLRGQVKALLHKVEEEQGCAAATAAFVRPARIQALLGVSRSPAQLLAPTPVNTPLLGPVTAAKEGPVLLDGSAVMPCVLEEEELLLPKLQVVAASLPPPPAEESLGECQLNRALVFDESPGKSDASTGSVVSSSASLQEISSRICAGKSSSAEDDSSSAWSVQVHASSEKGEEEEELGVDGAAADELVAGEYTGEGEWEEDSDDDFDDLCEVMSRMTVLDGEEERKKAGLPQFEGSHTRFIYNSDDEIEREEVDAAEARAELGAMLLRGMPVPEGRHLRFHEDDEDED